MLGPVEEPFAYPQPMPEPRSLALRLLGGAAGYPSTQQWSAAGLLSAQLHIASGWDAGLAGVVESPLRAGALGGEVSAWSADLLGTVRWTTCEWCAWRVYLNLGAGLSRIAAASERYPEVGSAALYRPCFLAAADSDLRITDSIWLTASLALRVRTSREEFAIDNVGTVLSLGAARLFGLVGVAWTPQ